MSRKTDFTLDELRFLITLLETRSLTIAAERHELSMGAASRRLARLRVFFEDELFVRSGLVMLPTQRMREIESDVKRVLATMGTLMSRAEFDLANNARTVRILAMDNGVSTLLSDFFGTFYKESPRSTIEIEQLDAGIFERLREGRADLALYPIAEVPKDFHSIELYKSRRGILVREGHPLIEIYERRGRITVADLAPFRRVKTSFTGAPEWADTTVRTATAVQQVGLEMPFFLSVPHVLAKTDFTFVAPVITIQHALRRSGAPLRSLPAPPELAPFSPHLVWHHCSHTDPFLQWVRGIITNSARETAREAGVLVE